MDLDITKDKQDDTVSTSSAFNKPDINGIEIDKDTIIPQESIDSLISSGKKLHLFIIARYYYKYHIKIIPDKTYNLLKKDIEVEYPNTVYLDRLYEDDPVPNLYLKAYNMPLVKETHVVTNNVSYLLTEDTNRSIDSLETEEAVLDFLTPLIGVKVMLSCKIDGISTNNMYDSGRFVQSLSRGRSGRFLDYTNAARQVLPRHIDSDQPILARAEAFCENIEYLSDKYNRNYASQGSAALSGLQGIFDPEDYTNMRIMVFGLNMGNSHSESLELAKSLGFEIVPYVVDTVPKDNILEWVHKHIDYFYYMDIPKDGMVITIDDKTDFKLRGEKSIYSLGNKAIRIGKFSSQIFSSKVLKLIWSNNKGKYSIKAGIVPVDVPGKKARLVNLHNPDIMIKAGIKVGSEILFEVKDNGSIILAKEMYK